MTDTTSTPPAIQPDDDIDDTDCIDADGDTWPEHDYPDDHHECRRCGAEAPQD